MFHPARHSDVLAASETGAATPVPRLDVQYLDLPHGSWDRSRCGLRRDHVLTA